ncbi:hypothetical protein T484DRAFT_1646610 [Baffinella frigidus]|nr:hypothetical protein T484DRAFT_1646610 [Cryptophyta sp. CCMP2293]
MIYARPTLPKTYTTPLSWLHVRFDGNRGNNWTPKLGFNAVLRSDLCGECFVGSYKDTAGSESCSNCPLHTSSVSGSDNVTDCKCMAGHNGTTDGVECTACLIGEYTDRVGVGHCSMCPTGTSSVGGSQLTGCKCVTGYTGISRPRLTDGTVCTACETGTYKPTIGTGECVAGPWHTTSPEGSDNVTYCTCWTGYTSESNGMPCHTCDMVFTIELNESCSASKVRTFKSAVGNESCETCHVNSESDTGSALCQSLAPRTV